MKSLVLSNFNQMWLPLLALMIFISVFVIMLIHISRKSSKRLYNEAQNIPLDEGVKK
jgi:cbb3-type cytochrome oxidase subunit 3